MNLLLKDNKFGFTKFSGCRCAGGGSGGGCSTSSSVTSGTRYWIKSFSYPAATGGGQSPPPPPPRNCPPGGSFSFDPNGAPRISGLRYSTNNSDLFGTETIPPTLSGDPSCQPNCICSSGGGGCNSITTPSSRTNITTETSSITVTLTYTVSQDWILPAIPGTSCSTQSSVTTSTNVTETITVPATRTNYEFLLVMTTVTTCTC